MSAIFGILNLDGRPLEPERLERMREPMAYWGPDDSGVCSAGPVGLGQLMLRGTPESEHEALPLESGCGRYLLTAAARIDNRAELLDLFGVPAREHATTPDSALILNAYAKWAEQCPAHLLGDWAFAVWERGRQRLFMARDHHGNTGLYYCRTPQFFAFSSCVKGLLALLPGRPALNEFRLAQVLTAWPAQGPDTVYEGIHRLPPAHCMSVRAGAPFVHRYWYAEHVPPLRLRADEEYVEAFKEIYGEAVRCRLRTLRPAAVTLSGGLDSGSVTAVAARFLGESGKPLPALSFVPRHDVRECVGPGRLGDESELIEATATHAGNVDMSFIRAEHVTPLQGVRRSLELHDAPQHAAGNAFWITALMAEAQARGFGTLLTGQGGNATISWHRPGYLRELVRTGRWLTLWRELRALARHRGKPLWRMAAGRLALPLLAPLLRTPSARRRPWAGYSAIAASFAERLQLRQRMAQAGHDPYFLGTGNPRAMRLALLQPGRTITGGLWLESGAGHALDVRDPTLDKRVIEFCLAIPDTQFARHGQDRLLIRRAMQGLLPDTVRLNQRVGIQAADIGPRLRTCMPEVYAALDQLARCRRASEMLDLHKMREAAAALEQPGAPIRTDRLNAILLRGLSVGLFVARRPRGS